jgi:erythritol transport system substrate-binding protein
MGEKGSYLELLGRESDNNAQIRTRGFHDVIDRYPGLILAGQQSANWSQTEGFQKMETMIQAHHGVKGVIAGNDTMALGARAALEAAGLDKVIVVGFDGSPDAIAAVGRGSLKATVLQPASVIARLAVGQVHKFLTTGATGAPEKQSIDCELVTPANAGEFGLFGRK